MKTFTIEISDAQRLILLMAINQTFAGLIPDVESPAALLFDMLRDLPQEEAKSPAAIHSFTS
jgi:hypothetical protein